MKYDEGRSKGQENRSSTKKAPSNEWVNSCTGWFLTFGLGEDYHDWIKHGGCKMSSAVWFARPIVWCVIYVAAMNLRRLRRDLRFSDWVVLFIYGCLYGVPGMRGWKALSPHLNSTTSWWIIIDTWICLFPPGLMASLAWKSTRALIYQSGSCTRRPPRLLLWFAVFCRIDDASRWT